MRLRVEVTQAGLPFAEMTPQGSVQGCALGSAPMSEMPAEESKAPSPPSQKEAKMSM